MSEVFSKGIEELKNKLIDTSRRNKLINYKRPSKTRNLKIIDESAEFIYHHLIKDEKKFRFSSIPEPYIDSKEIEELKKEKERLEKKLNEKNLILSELEKNEITNTLETVVSRLTELQEEALLTAEERAKELGFEISSELPIIDLLAKDVDKKHIDDSLQTLHYPNEMEKILKNIERNARSIIEETGSNMLYLVLGVLKWHEADHSDYENKSPLITIPLTLTKTKRNSKFDFTLEYSGEGLETNRSLAEKLLIDFGLVLPELTEEVSFSEYIQQVQSVINGKKRWSIRQEIALDFLHFGKILMYQDLKEDNWQDGLVSNPILTDIFIGKEVESDSTFAPEYDIDTNEIANSLPLVMDADSSQHSAVVDVIKNQNVIIEGPPGTGKSQTITNIIAALLAEGKSVLFVSEKLAALEVVYKRLENIGLGDFCLELHSHKSQKARILHSIQKRMDSRYPDINVREHTIKDIEHRKYQLREYINTIHQHFGKIDQTIYSIFWKTELFSDGSKYLRFDIPNAKEYTPFQLHNIRDELDNFKHFHGNYDYESFFWRGLDLYKLNFIDIDNFLLILEETKEKFKILQKQVSTLPSHLENEYNDVEKINSFIKSFQVSKSFDKSILVQVHNNINDFKLYLDTFNKAKNLTQKLDDSLQGFTKYRNYNNRFIANLDILEQVIKKLSTDFNVPKNFDIEFIATLMKVFGLLNQLDIKQYEEMSDRYGTIDLEITMREGKTELQKHKEYQTAISKYSDPQVIDKITLDDFVRIEGIIESKKNSIFNIFSSEYQKTLKAFQSLLTTPLSNDKSEWIKLFNEIKQYIQSKNDYNSNSKYAVNFGNLFKGTDTDWDEINVLNEWAKQLRNATRNSELINIILSPNNQKFKELLAIKSSLEDTLLEFDDIYNDLGNYYDKTIAKTLIRSRDDINVVELKDKLEDLNNELESVSLILHNELDVTSSENFTKDVMTNIVTVDFEELNYEIQKIDMRVNDFQRQYDAFVKQSIKFKSKVQKINESYDLNLKNPINDYIQIQDTLETYATIKDSDVSENIKQMLFQNFNNYLNLVQLSKSYDELLQVQEQINTFGELSKSFYGKNEVTFSDCINKLEEAPKHQGTLSIWSDFRKISHSVMDLGLNKLVEQVESKTLPLDKINDVFNFNFYNTLVKDIFRENPLLLNFSRLTHEQLINTYKELDEKLIEENRKKVTYLASIREIPRGYRSNRKSELTELSLIENEVSKKKRHIPIRQLVRRAPAALKGLKPCFMMSPLSVSQYLPPNDILFDVLIVDEASQLRPEEALGSIARAKQIVIVGDPKQLPPTSFFNSMDKSTEDETVASESESILDICANLYKPIRQLRWHYRSQHESLIDFSNQQFYDGNLLVFPSPTSVNSDTLGIKYHYIENSVYQSGRNKVEAKIIVEHLELQMKKYPDRSIGVGTFNSSQRDLIQDMLDEREKKSLVMGNYISEWRNSSEPFFIKNLENLQGDERDVIFISTTYGKDKDTGKVYQRFGPINSDVGWRRLNVMVTRSKQKMEVFTSLNSSDIIVADKSSRGVRALKSFLKFLETSTLTKLPEVTDRGFDSEFEESVYKILYDAGYKIVPQVGVAGYFIDLAVVSEKNPNDFVLAIECDGASYHSSKSARDRDRLRQDVLERLGWSIYRIWSVDWYKNRENEISKLIQAVREAQEAYQVYEIAEPVQDIVVHEIEDTEDNIETEIENEEHGHHNSDVTIEQSIYTQSYLSDERLREMLVELRDTKISKEFEIDKRCILSDLMIEQFVKYKPLDMDEFRDSIPRRYRDTNVIHIEQMKFMPDIFEILELGDE